MPVQHRPPAPATKKASSGADLILNVAHLSFSYPDGQPALHDVSLQVAAGEKVGLVGPNGAGKSTLMLHLNGLLQGEGAIEVAGQPLTAANLPIIRGQLGLVFQNPDDQLFSPTVFEDVAFGPLHMGLAEAEVRRRVAWALEQVKMSDVAERQPYHLSMGQKKRVALATVLALDAELLVLDEPSAGLDPRARRSLIGLLDELPQTMLIASHDMRLVRDLCPRMVVMDEGRIVADGATADLLLDLALLDAHGLEPA